MTDTPFLPRLGGADASLEETLRIVEARRRVLRWTAVAGAALLLPKPSRACTIVPQEIAGPFPGDGTNGPNVLTESGIVRADIRSSFGAAGSAIASGTPNSVTLRLVSTTSACAPLAGRPVYVWHCDRNGGYSMYSNGIVGENYLRGVQLTDANGEVTFTSIYPACYDGRWPHIHFEVYALLGDVTSGRNAIRTSQIALPETASRQVYAQTALYPGSSANLDRVSLQSDLVFGDDGGIYELATVDGDNDAGYSTVLEVGIALDAASPDPIFASGFES